LVPQEEFEAPAGPSYRSRTYASARGGRSAKRVEDELAAALLANARGEP